MSTSPSPRCASSGSDSLRVARSLSVALSSTSTCGRSREIATRGAIDERVERGATTTVAHGADQRRGIDQGRDERSRPPSRLPRRARRSQESRADGTRSALARATANSEQRTAKSEQQLTNSKKRTTTSEQRTANSEPRTANNNSRTAKPEQRLANSEQRTANSEQQQTCAANDTCATPRLLLALVMCFDRQAAPKGSSAAPSLTRARAAPRSRPHPS